MIYGAAFFLPAVRRGGFSADAGTEPAPCRSGCGREDARRRADGAEPFFFLRCTTGVAGMAS